MKDHIYSAAYLTDIESLEIRDYLVGDPAPDEVAVDIDCVGICGSDISYYTKGRTGVGTLTFPHILGHESTGKIASIGKNVTDLQIGDRVAIEPGVPCGICSECLSGHYNCCKNISFMSTAKKMKYSDGAFVTRTLRPAAFVHKLPDSVSSEAGAMLEPLSVAYHAIRESGVKPGDNAAIIGCGPIAGCLLLTLKSFGIKQVAMSDVLDSRLELMKELGAAFTVNTASMNNEELSSCFGGEFNAIFDTSCNEKAINSGIAQLKQRAVLMQVGVSSKYLNLDIPTLFLKEGSFKTSFRYANTYSKCIDLIKQGLLDPLPLISHTYSFSEISKAFRTASSKDSGVMKVLLKMN